MTTRDQVINAHYEFGRLAFEALFPGIFDSGLDAYVKIANVQETLHEEYDVEVIETSEPDASGCVTVVEAYTVDYEITFEIQLWISITEDDTAVLAAIENVPWFKITGEERERTRVVCPEPIPEEDIPLPPLEQGQDYAILLDGKELWRGKGATSVSIRKGNTGSYVPRSSDGDNGTYLAKRLVDSLQRRHKCETEQDKHRGKRRK